MRKFGLLVLIISLSIPSFCQEKQTRKEKRLANRSAAYSEVVDLVKSGAFVFIAERAFPQGYQPVELSTHTAELSIQNDSVASYLPYFGRTFVAGYGGSDSGIKFENELEDFNVEYDDDKSTIRLKFKAKGEHDTFNCNMEIKSKKSVTFYVISNNKAGISYSGYLKEFEQDNL